MTGVSLLLSEARSIHIPRDFVENFNLDQWHIKSTYMQWLSSPADELYWDCWDVVLGNAYLIDENGNKWVLLQDGDLWTVCYDLMTDDEKMNFGFEEF